MLLTQLGEAWTKGIESETARVFAVATPSVTTLFLGALITGSIAMTAAFIAALRTGVRPPLQLFQGASTSLSCVP
ncbi:MAG: hypothetical protein QGI29_06770, partial [Pirellulales bacterium]|nr:hypothetical protein [Pirellulales bacterium]